MTGTAPTAASDQRAYVSQLPAKARELVDFLGLPATLLLVKEYGGQTFMVPKGKRARGVARMAEMTEAIGQEAAEKLCHTYGGEYLAVPACKRPLQLLRDADMQSRFDALTSRLGGQSARNAVNQIAKDFGTNSSTVWRALKRVS
ncbi:MAG: Mor transcription activator family protein [Sulfuritalea sp.]|nr:Mor transcription activator family protein [Sulfuritalea sp.]